ncbi:MAG: conjugal transfer protein TraR [Streptosporangiales bacterium]|nr:conjugal transfer protein TraR [Streptosporangiales bacterium]
MDPATARKRLEEMLADLDRSIDILRGEHRTERIEELPFYDTHPADSGSTLSDTDRGEAVLEAAKRQRGAVAAAIERIDAGTYGLCVDCGTTVPDGRLEARPEAARCVQCQSKLERR